MNSLDLAKQIEQFYLDARHQFHAYPELGGEEVETQKYIIKQLELLGIEYDKVGNTSTIAYINGTKDNGANPTTIAFRADIDALPMQEEGENVACKSTRDGIAHACGHDAHAAILLGAAKLLKENQDQFNGRIKLFFQEAEETTSGAKKIIEAGGMDDVEMIFALHCLNAFEAGKVSIAEGYQLTGQDLFKINWTGVSGHGSSPHKAKDSLHAAAVFVADVQSAVTKSISPMDTAVVTCGVFQAGTVSNIIPKHTVTKLTFRYFKEDVRKAIHEAVKLHAESIGAMYGVDADVTIRPGVPGTRNDPKAVDIMKESYSKITSPENIIHVDPLLSSEDFSLYLEHAPGAMAWLGIKNEDIEAIYYPHHDKWKIDEEALKYGVAWLYQTALDYLE